MSEAQFQTIQMMLAVIFTTSVEPETLKGLLVSFTIFYLFSKLHHVIMKIIYEKRQGMKKI